MGTQSKAMTIAGWILTVFVVGMLIFSASMKFAKPPDVTKMVVEKFGYQEESLLLIGILELTCVIIFAFPRTAILGAVLLTGYLGGAVATHVRVQDNPAGAVVGGVLVWLAVFLRDPRVRALLPWRRPT